ncbi:PilZ domain-containing protein [Marinobacter persicus]|uniref:PilZ domain-containing protein n=1 Tax=Marinobacter persicus TaxID=930118 RepID=A0A1I3TXM8_9GAMM|nr:PilZ domain-containing protein [Marinobacter persicus]GHD45618.1 hypothetical protein GCM10008110_11580 [Marinobacter persicus]SFJ75430.1 PilZ domain-containing protein [Marinobacter persicus]
MTDQNYTFGTGPELPRGHDDRASYRLTARAVAGIQLEAPEPSSVPLAGADKPRIAQCRIRDISTDGFSLLAREPLMADSILGASIDLGNGRAPFQLMIEVVWCRPVKEGYLVGVRVLESDETDYLEWMDAVAQALAES